MFVRSPRRETWSVVGDVHEMKQVSFEKEARGYDTRDDKTLSGVQTATNKEDPYRYRAMHLR